MSNSIPVLSLAKLDTDDQAERLRLAQDLDKICQDIGFLLVDDHGIDLSLLQSVFANSKLFFAAEQSLKDRWHPRGEAKQRGYHGYATRGLAATLGQDTPLDMRESLFFGPVDDHREYFSDEPSAQSVYAPNLYPNEPIELHACVTDLYRAFEDFSARLLRLMAEALNASPDYFDSKISRHFSILASHSYPPPAAAPLPGQLRTGEHSDFGAFTILAMTQAEGGLEVRMRDGQWRPVQARAGQLIVNLGDMMARWTNDRWVSTLHRVAVPALTPSRSSYRQSIGYFMHPDYDASVECLPSLLANGEIAAHPPITAGEHIRAKIARSHGD